MRAGRAGAWAGHRLGRRAQRPRRGGGVRRSHARVPAPGWREHCAKRVGRACWLSRKLRCGLLLALQAVTAVQPPGAARSHEGGQRVESCGGVDADDHRRNQPAQGCVRGKGSGHSMRPAAQKQRRRWHAGMLDPWHDTTAGQDDAKVGEYTPAQARASPVHPAPGMYCCAQALCIGTLHLRSRRHPGGSRLQQPCSRCTNETMQQTRVETTAKHIAR